MSWRVGIPLSILLLGGAAALLAGPGVLDDEASLIRGGTAECGKCADEFQCPSYCSTKPIKYNACSDGSASQTCTTDGNSEPCGETRDCGTKHSASGSACD